jgi:hypothetical protein
VHEVLVDRRQLVREEIVEEAQNLFIALHCASLKRADPLASSARPYRHEVGGTIARATLRREAISDLVDARATTSAGSTTPSDVGHRPRTLVDRAIDIAFRRWVTQADEHDFDFDNGFQNQLCQEATQVGAEKEGFPTIPDTCYTRGP